MTIKFTELIDYNDYLENEVPVLIVYNKPKRNTGIIQVTDPLIISNWPKSMDEYLEINKEQIRRMYGVKKIRRLDK